MAAVLAAVFPLLLAALSFGLWRGLWLTSAVAPAERESTWLVVTIALMPGW